jgi:hypothetical protein
MEQEWRQNFSIALERRSWDSKHAVSRQRRDLLLGHRRKAGILNRAVPTHQTRDLQRVTTDFVVHRAPYTQECLTLAAE